MSTARPPESAARRFEVLDALRGICALFVALFHFRAEGFITSTPLVQNGWLFVDYFFVLSGFVIAHGYGFRLQDREVSPARFLALRFARIYPLHFAVLLGFVLVELALWLFADQLAGLTSREAFTGSRSLPSLGENLLLLQSLGIHDGLTWNGPAWSISAEMWTYVLFAGVLLLRGRALVLACVGFAIAALAFVVSNSDTLDITYNLGIVRAVLGFSIGVLTYLGFQRFGGPRGTTWEALAMLLAILFVSLARDEATFAAPLVFAATIWLLAPEGGAIAQLLRNRLFQFLGLLSYSIYMVHIFVQARLGEALQVLKIGGVSSDAQGITNIDAGPVVGDMLTLLMVTLVVATSWLTYRLVEEPGRRLLRRILA